jgi:hypothetical protein
MLGRYCPQPFLARVRRRRTKNSTNPAKIETADRQRRRRRPNLRSSPSSVSLLVGGS